MTDLLGMAMSATQRNVVKTARKENINEALCEDFTRKVRDLQG